MSLEKHTLLPCTGAQMHAGAQLMHAGAHWCRHACRCIAEECRLSLRSLRLGPSVSFKDSALLVQWWPLSLCVFCFLCCPLDSLLHAQGVSGAWTVPNDDAPTERSHRVGPHHHARVLLVWHLPSREIRLWRYGWLIVSQFLCLLACVFCCGLYCIRVFVCFVLYHRFFSFLASVLLCSTFYRNFIVF